MDEASCRTCLTKCKEMLPLLSFIDGTQILIMLKNLISKKIALTDGTSNNICKPCGTALTLAYKFKIQCEESNTFIEKQSKATVVENYPNEINELNVTNGFQTISTPKLEENIQKFLCCKCNSSFSFKDELKVHSRIHSVEKLFLCSICGKNYHRSMHLLIHMRSHTGDKPYICNYCKKGFKQSSDLNVHLRIHTGERNKICRICNKSFVTSSALNKHLRVHTGDRPFKCTICTKQFSESYGLVKHMRVHTGEKPYKCSICKNSFSQSTSLKKHKKIHENKKIK